MGRQQQAAQLRPSRLCLTFAYQELLLSTPCMHRLQLSPPHMPLHTCAGFSYLPRERIGFCCSLHSCIGFSEAALVGRAGTAVCHFDLPPGILRGPSRKWQKFDKGDTQIVRVRAPSVPNCAGQVQPESAGASKGGSSAAARLKPNKCALVHPTGSFDPCSWACSDWGVKRDAQDRAGLGSAAEAEGAHLGRVARHLGLLPDVLVCQVQQGCGLRPGFGDDATGQACVRMRAHAPVYVRLWWVHSLHVRLSTLALPGAVLAMSASTHLQTPHAHPATSEHACASSSQHDSWSC